MSSVEVENVQVTKMESSSEQLKTILSSMGEQSTQLKTLMNNVRAVLKDVERQGKELDKLHNKKSRNSSARKESGQPSGITKPVAISDELAKFLGVDPGTLVPRNEVTKGVSAFVRKHELSDPTNKQKFVLTSKPEGSELKTLLGNPTEEVTYFNLQRYLKHHYISTEKAPPVPPKIVSSPPTPIVVPAPSLETSPAEPETPKVKKVVKVVKKKASELSEE
jgi:chromatin remodeling complex protein RSC6